MRAVCLVCDVFHPSEESTGLLFTALFNRLAAGGLRIAVITNRLPHERRLRESACPIDPRISIRRVGIPIDAHGSVVFRILKYLLFILCATVRLLFAPEDRFWGSTNPPFTPVWLAFIAMLRSRPFDVIVHDVYPDGLVALGYLRPDSPVTRTWTALNHWAYRRAEKVFVLGRDMAELMRSRYGVEQAKLVLFPNWSPFDTDAPSPITNSRLAHRLGCQHKFVVQYSGNMGLWHDIDTLVRAADLLRADQRIVFLMIGGGRRRQQSQRLAEELGLENMIWLDFQPRSDLHDSLACASASIISQREGLVGVAVPCKLYGVLASARAVVALVPAASEVAFVVEEEHCGILVPPGDAEALADGIRRLAADPEKVEEMGRRAFVAYRTKYSLAVATDRFWRLWTPQNATP